MHGAARATFPNRTGRSPVPGATGTGQRPVLTCAIFTWRAPAGGEPPPRPPQTPDGITAPCVRGPINQARQFGNERKPRSVLVWLDKSSGAQLLAQLADRADHARRPRFAGRSPGPHIRRRSRSRCPLYRGTSRYRPAWAARRRYRAPLVVFGPDAAQRRCHGPCRWTRHPGRTREARPAGRRRRAGYLPPAQPRRLLNYGGFSGVASAR